MLISAGPTREPVDPVRFLSNYSTGYMGAQLAAEAVRRRHHVVVVSGPGGEPLPPAARVLPVETANDMARALQAQAQRADAIIMAAAVADFRPTRRSLTKLTRGAGMTLQLEPTPDVIAELPRRPRQVVVGFALETDQVLARARAKLVAKRLDLLVAQQTGGRDVPAGSPFGRRPVRAWLLEAERAAGPRAGRVVVSRLGRLSKPILARVLLDKIEALWYGQPDPLQAAHAT